MNKEDQQELLFKLVIIVLNLIESPLSLRHLFE